MLNRRLQRQNLHLRQHPRNPRLPQSPVLPLVGLVDYGCATLVALVKTPRLTSFLLPVNYHYACKVIILVIYCLQIPKLPFKIKLAWKRPMSLHRPQLSMFQSSLPCLVPIPFPTTLMQWKWMNQKRPWSSSGLSE